VALEGVLAERMVFLKYHNNFIEFHINPISLNDRKPFFVIIK